MEKATQQNVRCGMGTLNLNVLYLIHVFILYNLFILYYMNACYRTSFQSSQECHVNDSCFRKRFLEKGFYILRKKKIFL